MFYECLIVNNLNITILFGLITILNFIFWYGITSNYAIKV